MGGIGPVTRFRIGAFLLAFGFACPLLIPLVARTNLSTEVKTAIFGLLAIGVPELFMVIAVAVMGREGFSRFKKIVFGIARRFAPPERVGALRYRIGLAMFAVPLVFGWLAPYVQGFVPGYRMNRVAIGVAGDLLLVTSLFVLGGEFWDKLRSLFDREATVRFREGSVVETG